MAKNQTGTTVPTIQDHKKKLEPFLPLLAALPVDAVAAPAMPVATFLDEGRSAVAAAREHLAALEAVGMPKDLPDQLEERLEALAAAQFVWLAEMQRGRKEDVQTLIDEATRLRADVLAAADLALRKNPEGQRRMATIREGEGLPDLVLDLDHLALLLGDARPLFEAIKLDVPATAKALAEHAVTLRASLAREDAAKTLSSAKDLRDRVYTLAREPLDDLRAFAAYAFRGDRGNQRRAPFLSAWIRRSNASRRRKAEGRNEPPSTKEA